MRHFESLRLNKAISPHFPQSSQLKGKSGEEEFGGLRQEQVTEEEEREPEWEKLVNEKRERETHRRAPLVPIKFSFIHLAAQRCIAPICQAQELNSGLELGDLLSHAVLCPARITR